MQLADLDHDVGRQAVAPRRLANQLGAGRLVQAVGLLLVDAEERVQPADANVVVDAGDARRDLGRDLELVSEVALDQVQGHGSSFARYVATVVCTDSRGSRPSWRVSLCLQDTDWR